MKTCPACLDSVELAAGTCPSCGERLLTPIVQPISSLSTQVPSDQEPQPTKPKASNINPLFRLYALVFLAIAVLAIGSTVVLTNNASEGDTPAPSPTTQPTETQSPTPSETFTPNTDNNEVKASSIMAPLIKAGVCDELDYLEGEMGTYGADDKYRTCVVPSFTQQGGELYNSIDKYVSIYTGDDLSTRFADVENLRVFEVAMIGDGWTLVVNYFPSSKKSYLDDPDIKAIIDLLDVQSIKDR